MKYVIRGSFPLLSIMSRDSYTIHQVTDYLADTIAAGLGVEMSGRWVAGVTDGPPVTWGDALGSKEGFLETVLSEMFGHGDEHKPPSCDSLFILHDHAEIVGKEEMRELIYKPEMYDYIIAYTNDLVKGIYPTPVKWVRDTECNVWHPEIEIFT